MTTCWYHKSKQYLLMQPINDIMINYGLACAPYSHGTHRPVINIFMHTEDTIQSIINTVIFYLCYTESGSLRPWVVSDWVVPANF